MTQTCHSQPCRFTDLCTNNNTCLNEVISFKCKCSPGFRGEFCENRVISSTTAKPGKNYIPQLQKKFGKF